MSAITERRGDPDGDSWNTTVVKSFLAATYRGQMEIAFDRYAQRDLAWVGGTYPTSAWGRAGKFRAGSGMTATQRFQSAAPKTAYAGPAGKSRAHLPRGPR